MNTFLSSHAHQPDVFILLLPNCYVCITGTVVTFDDHCLVAVIASKTVTRVSPCVGMVGKSYCVVLSLRSLCRSYTLNFFERTVAVDISPNHVFPNYSVSSAVTGKSADLGSGGIAIVYPAINNVVFNQRVSCPSVECQVSASGAAAGMVESARVITYCTGRVSGVPADTLKIVESAVGSRCCPRDGEVSGV